MKSWEFTGRIAILAARVDSPRAFAILVISLLVFFGPPLLGDRVLLPHDNAAEAGLQVEGLVTRSSLLRSQLYIPEMHAHVACEHRGWLAAWNPHNELGRPLLPFGSTFIVGHALSNFTDDAFRYYTWTAVLAVCGTALFGFLFLRELGLYPLACLAGALGISVGPLYLGWPSFPMLQSCFCWTFAALLAVARWLKRPGPWSWLGVAFAVHAILLTGYPQLTVYLGWISGGWVLLEVVRARRGARARVGALVLLSAAALVGVLSVAPVYVDVLFDWLRSARGGASAPGVPQLLDSAWGLGRHWLGLYDTFSLDLAFGAQWYSLSPVYAGLVAIAVLAWRSHRAWYWLSCAGLAFAATVSEPLSRVLCTVGLAISEWPQGFAGLLPCAVLAALGVDHAIRAPRAGRRTRVAVAAAPLLVAALTVFLVGVEVELASALLGVALGLGVGLFAAWPRAGLLLPLIAVVVFHPGRESPIWQRRSDLHTDSPLASEVRRLTADGSRFAWVGPRPPGFRFLTPNQEIPLGLASVHGYDLLTSRIFDAWSRPLGPPTSGTFIQTFDSIAAESSLEPRILAASGVSTLLSILPVSSTIAEPRARIAGIHVSSVRHPGPLESLLPSDAFELGTVAGGRHAVVPLAALAGRTGGVRRVTLHHDQLRFETVPAQSESLLFISQQFHPHWRARAGSRELVTLCVNRIYQGVLLPPGTAQVELTFEPWSRWAIVPQGLFALAGLGALLAGLGAQGRRRRRRALAREFTPGGPHPGL